MTNEHNNDPLNFMRKMWDNMGFSLPGMITPTFDLDELDKRIKDMKAVEGWLRTNLSMLQMTIQGLEMQRTTVSTVQTMGKMASDAAKSMSAAAEADAEEKPATEEATLWPWQMMDQIREQMQRSAEAAPADVTSEQKAEKPARRRSRKQ
jgi:hypothetical protein